MTSLNLTYVGTHWAFSGDLFYMTHDDPTIQARVFVDSVGETWVDIRRIPEGGFFYSERVEAYRVFGGAESEAIKLAEGGFGDKRYAKTNARERMI